MSPSLVCSSATLFSYALIGLFSSAVVAAAGGVVATVSVVVVSAVVSVVVVPVVLFTSVPAGAQLAATRTNIANNACFKTHPRTKRGESWHAEGGGSTP